MKKEETYNPMIKLCMDLHRLDNSEFADLWLYIQELLSLEDPESDSVPLCFLNSVLKGLEIECERRKIKILTSPEGCSYVAHIVD